MEDGSKDWRSRKICCCPLWLLLLCMLVVPVIILILWLTIDFPKPEFAQNGTVNGTASEVGVMEGVVIAVLGVPAVSALKFIFLMVKNLIFSQDLNIRRRMDNEQISKQLGFMNEIRKEMWYLSRFIQFMEVFERRRIRVVLKITDLDRCSPKKIVGVLDAINILLSDEESPYISILAVNPEVLIERVNFADGCFSKEDRAYAFLNRIITLPFTVPPLCDASKLSLFWHLIRNSEIQEDRNNIGHRNRRVVQNNRSFSNVPLMEVSLETNESQPLHVKDEEVEELVSNILKSNGKRLNKYLLDDVMSMRRVINSIRVTVIIMKVLKIDFECPDNIAPWVVLANQWPCRLSWIIQCVEDAQQRADIDHESMANTDNSKTLWQVFSESRAELYVMSAQIEELLEHDGDPEMFEKFLRVDFQFTIKDLKALEAATVNLDHTILKELAQLRGTSRLKDSGWMRNIAPLPIATIINMDTEDVCNEVRDLSKVLILIISVLVDLAMPMVTGGNSNCSLQIT